MKEDKADATATGAVRADRLKLMGELRVTGNCEVESLLLSGVFDIGGMLMRKRSPFTYMVLAGPQHVCERQSRHIGTRRS